VNPSYFLAWCGFRTFYKFYCGWRVFNPERVPRNGPVILASNHASFLDPPLVGSGLTRDINYLARESLFRFPITGWILRSWNSVPVDREGKLQPARSGIGLTVIKSNAPVVPVRVFGTFEAFGRHMRFPRRHRVVVKYGRPLYFEKLRSEAKACSKPRLKEIYQEVANELMRAIAKLEPCEDKEQFP